MRPGICRLVKGGCGTHIILIALKVILFAILAVLGMLVLLLCIVLLVPIRYRIWSKRDETVDVKVQVHWLLHLVSVLLLVEQGKVTVGKVKLCGFTLMDFLSDKGKVDAGKTEGTDNNQRDGTGQSEAKSDVVAETGTVQGATSEENAENTLQSHKKKKRTARKKKKSKASRKPLLEHLAEEFERFCGFINTALDRLDEGIDAFWDKVSLVLDTISTYYTFATEDATVSLIKRVIATVVDFIRYILPVRLQGNLHLGMADPAGTGQICSIMAILLPWYEKNFTFTPDFEKQVMEGEVSCRGRIRLGHFIWKILVLVCCKDFWHVIKLWKGISAKKSVDASQSAPSKS